MLIDSPTLNRIDVLQALQPHHQPILCRVCEVSPTVEALAFAQLKAGI